MKRLKRTMINIPVYIAAILIALPLLAVAKILTLAADFLGIIYLAILGCLLRGEDVFYD